MNVVKLDSATADVKEFIRSLPIGSEGVTLEMDGETVCDVLPPNALLGDEKEALFARGREMMRRAQERNKGVPAAVIEREVRDAVDEVRRRGQQ